MRLRPHRRTLVVWSTHGGPDRYGLPWFTRVPRRRIRRCIRTGALLTVIGLMRLARAVQADWRLMAGGVLTAVGVMLRSGPLSVVMIPGLLLLVVALLAPPTPKRPEPAALSSSASWAHTQPRASGAILKQFLTCTPTAPRTSYATSSPGRSRAGGNTGAAEVRWA